MGVIVNIYLALLLWLLKSYSWWFCGGNCLYLFGPVAAVIEKI